MDVQKRIQILMKNKGWSEYRLAKESGLPQSTISHIFRRNTAPTYPTIEAVCNAFGVTISQFFADDGETVVLTEKQRKLLFMFGVLTEEEKYIVIEMMRLLGQ